MLFRSDMELAIFRLVQEALTNIHRHSDSKIASVHVSLEEQSVRIEVTDRGKGIPPEQLIAIQTGTSGVGIRGMQERLRHLGGTISIESSGSGTRVLASVPIGKELASHTAAS